MIQMLNLETDNRFRKQTLTIRVKTCTGAPEYELAVLNGITLICMLGIRICLDSFNTASKWLAVCGLLSFLRLWLDRD